MKTIKFVIAMLLISMIGLSLNSCSKCNGEDPTARIINNGTHKASVQIKTSGGNTVNINNVDPGTASPYASYAAGTVTFTITVNVVDYVETVVLSQCFDYDISINAQNVITTTPIDRNN